MKRILSAYICLCLSFSVYNIKAVMSTTDVSIGDPIKYRIICNNDQGISPDTIQLNLQDISDAGFYIITSSTHLKNNNEWSMDIVFTRYETGLYTVPTMTINLNMEKKDIPSVKINIRSIFRDGVTRSFVLTPKPPAHLTLKWWNYLLLFFVILMLVSVMVWLKAIFLKKGHDEDLDERTDPFDWIDKRLTDIEERREWGRDVRMYTFEISSVMKMFLSFVYNINIKDMTTCEAIQKLKKIVEKDILVPIQGLFQDMDTVKYARANMTINKAKALIHRSREIAQQIQVALQPKEPEDDY